MTGAILLIVEEEKDSEIVKSLLAARGIQVQVRTRIAGKRGGISRLAEQIDRLIQTALADKTDRDCIAVLHDADEKTRPHHREDYERIRAVCDEFQPQVKLIIARDELESWLLADTGICGWLGIRASNCDEQARPSDVLERHLKNRKKIKLQGRYRDEVLSNVRGDGDTYSPSMKEALRHLENAPCIRD